MSRLAAVLLVVGLMLGSVGAGETIYYRQDEDGVLRLTNVPDRPGLRAYRGRVRAPRSGAEFRDLIWSTASRHGVHPELVYAVAAVESNFNPQALSVKGAQGLMQLMPVTAERFGVSDPFDPAQNILGGVRFLRYLLDLFGGDQRLALAAYNAGENAVLAVNGVPPYRETRNYVAKVLKRFGTGRTAYVTPPQGSGASAATSGRQPR